MATIEDRTQLLPDYESIVALRGSRGVHMLVHMCCRQKDRVPIDAAAKLDHVQFRNKNVEYNYPPQEWLGLELLYYG